MCSTTCLGLRGAQENQWFGEEIICSAGCSLLQSFVTPFPVDTLGIVAALLKLVLTTAAFFLALRFLPSTRYAGTDLRRKTWPCSAASPKPHFSVIVQSETSACSPDTFPESASFWLQREWSENDYCQKLNERGLRGSHRGNTSFIYQSFYLKAARYYVINLACIWNVKYASKPAGKTVRWKSAHAQRAHVSFCFSFAATGEVPLFEPHKTGIYKECTKGCS